MALARRGLRRILVLVILLALLFSYIYYATLGPTHLNFYSSRGGVETEPPQQQQQQQRYITATIILCGRLGNMVWRFVSLYAIGRKLGRIPYFAGRGTCYRPFVAEAKELFPELGKRLLIFELPPRDEKVVEYGRHCCHYDDPLANRELANASEQYVRITGDYLQHPGFIADYDEEIRWLLGFSVEMQGKVEQSKEDIFKNDLDSHKLCVHSRRGDLIPQHIESSPEFTLAAINYTRATLLSNYTAVSVVLLGDDRQFMRDIQLNLSSAAGAGHPALQTVHLLPEAGMSRGEELCLAATHCNTLLITAPASTYAWWIGYLMMGRWGMRGEGGDGQQGGGLILYNGDMGRMTTPGTYDHSNFPREWIPVVFHHR